ncbi:hypothetical protein C8N46_102266 [Kordia periserrulae]|uniref:Uncharacterized protein n=1 Tax=Kordia periserrulae TaxID=701523 RepID=A0A2T6C3G0_9FLAO|nr:hypothetical protein [Kordia periserrulae]PTX62866.1 hypothetical protein C8N46_102266 [Kordia periserrulae]
MFGGSGAAFHVFDDLKRTMKRRAKRNAFDPKKRYYKDDGIQQSFPEITSQMRQKIRMQMLQQRKEYRRKLLIRLSIFSVIFGIIAYYLLFVVEITDAFWRLFTFG